MKLISAVNEETDKRRNRLLKPQYVFTYADCLYVPIKDTLVTEKKAIYTIIGVDTNLRKSFMGFLKLGTSPSACGGYRVMIAYK